MPAADPERASARAPARGARMVPLLRWVAIALAIAVLLATGRQLAAAIPAFAAWVEGLGAWGGIAFVGGYALAVIAFVPGSLLTLAAGAIFGLARGTAYVLVAATLGATGAFLVARHLVRPWVERRMARNPRFDAIDRAIASQGRRIVFLLRLSPAFPFTLLNYALGVTRVRFELAGAVARLAGGAATPRGLGYYAVLALGLAATIAVTAQVTRLARRALRQATEAA
jgi:uncharacterized membrane protein YdjX (TVP38/TMEM64 family)